jgi:hypothetical protein
VVCNRLTFPRVIEGMTSKLMIAGLLAVASLGALTGTADATTPSASLAVVRCLTTLGIPAPPAAAPRSVRVAVPAALAGKLAVYTDNDVSMELVGPQGWSCAAIDAADGSSGIVVYPRGEALPRTWSYWTAGRGSGARAIVGSQTSACVGCALHQACRLFPAAASALRSAYGESCPARPAAERVRLLRAGVAAFTDPPGVAGDGLPSGGRYQASGVMTYHQGSGNGSWLETCTLPASEASYCGAALSAFASWYGGR